MTIVLRKKDLPATLLAAFPDYRGRKYRLDASGRVCLHDLNWSGGTRNQYVLVRLADGADAKALPKELPWDPRCEGLTFDVPEGWCVVEHSVFLGQDCGLRFYTARGAQLGRLEAFDQISGRARTGGVA